MITDQVITARRQAQTRQANRLINMRQTWFQTDTGGRQTQRQGDGPGNRSTSEDIQTQRHGDDQATDRHQRTDRHKGKEMTRQQIDIRGQTQRQGDRPGNRSSSEDRHKGKETDQATDQHQRTDTKAKRQTRQQINIRGQTYTKARDRPGNRSTSEDKQTDRLTGSNRSQLHRAKQETD